MDTYDDVGVLYRGAMPCNTCFSAGRGLRHSVVDVPQPRWIGKKYPIARPRILIVALNPGAGASQHSTSNKLLRTLLHRFRDNSASFDEVLAFQRDDMFKWGKSPGVFTRFYTQATGKPLDELAFLNLAFCATEGNDYPAWMLSLCFASHTAKLMEALAPEVVLLSGSATHRFAKRIKVLLPAAKLIRVFHYAHREGNMREIEEFQRVQKKIINAV